MKYFKVISKLIKNLKKKTTENKIDKTKVDRDFVLKRIGPYIELTKNAKEDIYGKDYSVRHNDNALVGEHINILIDNKSFMASDIRIERNVNSYSRCFGDVKILTYFKDLERVEEVSFEIHLDKKFKFWFYQNKSIYFQKKDLILYIQFLVVVGNKMNLSLHL